MKLAAARTNLNEFDKTWVLPQDYDTENDPDEIINSIEKLNNWKDEKTAFLIQYDWFEALKDYLSENATRPGSIDQRPLVSDDNTLLSGLEEMIDYSIVSPKLWASLVSEFGLIGPALERNVLSIGSPSQREPFLDVYPPHFQLTILLNEDTQSASMYSAFPIRDGTLEAQMFRFSEASTVQEMEETVSDLLKLERGKFRLWYANQNYPIPPTISLDEFLKLGFMTLLSDDMNSMSLYELNIDRGLLVVELLCADGIWPTNLVLPKQTTSEGLVGIGGLYNLGNTCYMNSAIQCMFHTRELTGYFITNEYEKDVNYTNPLGMNGKVALSYASLVKQMNQQKPGSAIAPSSFKRIIGEFNTSFLGFSQQDSQEFIAFFLDGLHEDLNRVRKKPYVERPDLFEDNQQKVEQVANQCWEAYKKRNDSIVVSLFQGMYKSTLKCQQCQQISIVFDPFMYLTLPLPCEKRWKKCLTFMPDTPNQKPVALTLELDMDASISDMKNEVITKLSEMSIYVDTLLSCDIYWGKVHRIHYDHQKIRKAISKSDNIVLYGQKCCGDIVYAPVISASARDDICGAYQYRDAFGMPLQIQLPIGWVKQETIRESIISAYYATTGVGVGNNDFSILAYQSLKSNNAWEKTAETEVQKLTVLDEELVHVDAGTVFVAEWDEALKDKCFARGKMWIYGQQQPSTTETVTLNDCMREFSKPEKLSAKDAWYCPNCKDFRPATKTMEIWKLPKILVIHLNRFSCRKSWRRGKRNDLVTFPIEGLKLSEGSQNEWSTGTKDSFRPETCTKKYNLYAVDNHYGYMSSGHYTAFAKDFVSKKFYHFDDASQQLITEDDLVSPAAYVLFYELTE
ncbi:ubiquitin carboxy terminal hydrolase Ubp1 [Schizosaccharomyces japonicus yFS275]|uniref:Ubiquitin carboxyl-terminal hydrolase n=1 Tax=Schizosaccharomyces japonicus (strain yFS275 / FY16936) TaxID=402676 RepID=B6K687_SCHJY|nr:ubiquitin carboxy terminal hydrolase Ubp1 [Schizosaccharomyces japonicus yFS275]EEB09041.1 ubiquitin carboxy terminal hydrolase Ubp1 [Schizosaccharomyces japonicus yFS275]